MQENRFGQSSKVAKRTEVHPLCSRKRALSKIVASPSYKERQAKENHPPHEKKKKAESVVPKFKYLERKKRYGDDLLTKKKKKKVVLKETVQTATTIEENRVDAASIKTPFGGEKKEYIHPLCSRQRSLSKIVASPSYKLTQRPTKIATSSLYGIPPSSTPSQTRRYTMIPSLQDQNEENKENEYNVSEIASPSYTSTIRKSSLKDRRLTTFAKWKPQEEDPSFFREERGQEEEVMNSTEKEACGVTPWKNKKMSMRERLDLWLVAKNKTPTPFQPNKYQKSPHPNRKFKNTPHLTKLCEEDSNEHIEESPPQCLYSEENSAVISQELSIIIKKLENKVDRNEVEKDLDDMIRKYTTIVKFADYWICKARLASIDDDVQRVICLLEQAHTFHAQPGDKIKEEICRYLELLESCEEKGDLDSDKEEQLGEDRARLMSLYAITPGRRVHFAIAESPVEFKSSVIRFCLLESKAFKKRLNAQLKRKVITPVRRSLRVERSALPDFLRSDNRVVGSPGEVESDIIDGEISFVPNKTINTPLNEGWLIQDETKKTDIQDETITSHNEDKTDVRDEINTIRAEDEIIKDKTDISDGELEDIELSFM